MLSREALQLIGVVCPGSTARGPVPRCEVAGAARRRRSMSWWGRRRGCARGRRFCRRNRGRGQECGGALGLLVHPIRLLPPLLRLPASLPALLLSECMADRAYPQLIEKSINLSQPGLSSHARLSSGRALRGLRRLPERLPGTFASPAAESEDGQRGRSYVRPRGRVRSQGRAAVGYPIPRRPD